MIYFQKDKSLIAGILTLMRNRVGDVFMILVLGQIIINMRYMRFFSKRFFFELEDVSLLFFLTIAAITKRAQIPYSA